MSTRPLPHPTDISRPHWEGARGGELLVQRCDTCERYVFNPADVCPYCFGTSLTWTRSSGLGTVNSYTVVWRPPTLDFEVPFVVAIVTLEEGWHMLSNIVGCPVDEVHVDMPVEVTFEVASSEITLPLFRPRSSEAGA